MPTEKCPECSYDLICSSASVAGTAHYAGGLATINGKGAGEKTRPLNLFYKSNCPYKKSSVTYWFNKSIYEPQKILFWHLTDLRFWYYYAIYHRVIYILEVTNITQGGGITMKKFVRLSIRFLIILSMIGRVPFVGEIWGRIFRVRKEIT